MFERAVLNPPKVSTALREVHPAAEAIFRDAYFVEFLDLPDGYHETDLHAALLHHMRRFLVELGRDFCFIGSEVPLQVGGKDFVLDLLFFHRELACLIAIELKVGEFMPEHLGKLEFYLEALDRDVRKPREHPSIGVLLCANKDNEVVEYALSRSLSPTPLPLTGQACRFDDAPLRRTITALGLLLKGGKPPILFVWTTPGTEACLGLV